MGECRRKMKGEPTEIHGTDIMTRKHGAATDWMKANGECLNSLEEGDIIHVIDEDHANTDTQTEYKVTTVPTMEYDFHTATVKMVEQGTVGPAITIAPGKISKTAQR